jgi:hypothetical protein
MDQHSRQAGVGALAGLHHADGTKAVRIQIACEVAQHRVGVFMVVIDKGGKVALGVEHDTPLCWFDVTTAAALRRGREVADQAAGGPLMICNWVN